MVVYLPIALCLFILLWLALTGFDRKDGIDCGPDGQPALNGTACIDREPVVIP